MSKTHLARQEETVDEGGIQIRPDDPATPQEGQAWVNTSQNKFKIFINSEKRVFEETLSGSAIEIPISNEISGAEGTLFYKTLTGNATYNVEDIFDGLEVRVLITNNASNQFRNLDITLPDASDMNDGNYFLLKSALNQTVYYVWYDFNGTGNNQPIVAGATGVAVEVTQGRQETTVLTFSDGATTGNNQRFDINSANNTTQYYVWFNKDGAGIDPSVVGKTGIMVTINSADTAIQVADAVVAAVDAVADFNAANAFSSTVTLQNNAIGDSNDVVNISVSGLTINQLTDGADPDLAADVAAATSAALDALLAFSSSSVGNTLNVIYSDYGTADDPENVNIPTGFSFNVNTVGGGPISVVFPSNIRFEDLALAQAIPQGKTRLYKIGKISTEFYGEYVDYNNN